MSDAMERLIEAVAAGQSRPKIEDLACGPWPDDGSIWTGTAAAAHGDMNAALSILAALLPDHDWGRAPGGQMWVQRPPAAPVWSGDGYEPARGLLLAILRAKLAENHQHQDV